MKKHESYVKPEVSVCLSQTEYLLTSASGDNKDLEPGGSFGDAKRGWFDEEDEEEF